MHLLARQFGLRSRGQLDDESSPRPELALHTDRSPVGRHDLAGDVEPEPESAVMANGGGTPYPVEDSRLILRRNANPEIAHRQRRQTVLPSDFDHDRRSGTVLGTVR